MQGGVGPQDGNRGAGGHGHDTMPRRVGDFSRGLIRGFVLGTIFCILAFGASVGAVRWLPDVTASAALAE